MNKHTYDPESGLFFNHKGKQIGCYDRKYGRTAIEGKEVKLHRYAFYLMEGVWPKEEVDHINGDTHDNRWINLRKCSSEDNKLNKSKYKNNKSGYKGVYTQEYKGKIYYLAKIQFRGKGFYLGSYKTAEEAKAQYEKHAEILFENYKREETQQ